MTRLYGLFPRLQETLPSIRPGTAPTALRHLSGLAGGPAGIWLKDESTFGDGAWGGNKVRKLEWLVHHSQIITLKGKSYRLRNRGAGVRPAD